MGGSAAAVMECYVMQAFPSADDNWVRELALLCIMPKLLKGTHFFLLIIWCTQSKQAHKKQNWNGNTFLIK